jgi:hypothetical protein
MTTPTIKITQDGPCFTAIVGGRTFGTDAQGHGLWSAGVQLLDPAEYGATTAADMRWLVRAALAQTA